MTKGDQQRITQHKRACPDEYQGSCFATFTQIPPSMLMFYIYVLRNKNISRLYIGYTNDLKRRMAEHKKGNDNIELVYYEAYSNEKQSRLRERRLKLYGSAWRGLKNRFGFNA